MASESNKIKVGFLVSHPIQYNSPLFKILGTEKEISFRTFYCSEEGLVDATDVGFNQKVSWDIPLLDGYAYTFLKNYSPKPSIRNRPWGLINFGMLRSIFKREIDVLIVHDWAYITHRLALIFCWFLRVPLVLRTEHPVNFENRKPWWKRMVRQMAFKTILSKCHFLYIGSRNKSFYKMYGVENDRLHFCPYSVENARFIDSYESLKNSRQALRTKFEVEPDDVVVLFSGKLIPKKNPLDLLKAFQESGISKKKLWFLGDGPLRESLESYVAQNNIENVWFIGFKNQSELAEYYTAADLFVLPSGEGETWGLVVNEAMCFELPVVVSRTVGSAGDLVVDGENGSLFNQGNIFELASCLNEISTSAELRASMGRGSLTKVKTWSYAECLDGIKQALGAAIRK